MQHKEKVPHGSGLSDNIELLASKGLQVLVDKAVSFFFFLPPVTSSRKIFRSLFTFILLSTQLVEANRECSRRLRCQDKRLTESVERQYFVRRPVRKPEGDLALQGR